MALGRVGRRVGFRAQKYDLVEPHALLRTHLSRIRLRRRKQGRLLLASGDQPPSFGRLGAPSGVGLLSALSVMSCRKPLYPRPASNEGRKTALAGKTHSDGRARRSTGNRRAGCGATTSRRASRGSSRRLSSSAGAAADARLLSPGVRPAHFSLLTPRHRFPGPATSGRRRRRSPAFSIQTHAAGPLSHSLACHSIPALRALPGADE